MPVAVQHIFAANGGKLKSAAPLCRFQKKVHFRIMTKGLKMSDTFHRLPDSLLIYDASGAEFHPNAKTLLDDGLQHFNLDLAHQLGVDLPRRFIPYNVQLRLLFLQLPEQQISFMYITFRRQFNAVRKHRFQERKLSGWFITKPLSCIRFIKPCNGTDRAHRSFRNRFVSAPGINADLVNLLLPEFIFPFHFVTHRTRQEVFYF